MKTINFFIYLSLFCFLLSCDDEEVLPQLDAVAAPSELSLAFTPTTDNSGTVNIRPNGNGVTLYRIFFGDGTADPVEVEPGGAVDHIYPEGNYTVSMDAVGINGKTTNHTQELTVSFLPPENLVVTIAETAGNPLSIDVSATADLETSFEVHFGEDPAADPVSFQEGEVVQHAYQAVGTYEVIVMALSGGTQSISDTQMVTISNPLLLPIDFESATLDYSFTNFGGATGTVVDNPDQNEANNSSKVGQLNKSDGSEIWAGAFLSLGEPIDFSNFQKIGRAHV